MARKENTTLVKSLEECIHAAEDLQMKALPALKKIESGAPGTDFAGNVIDFVDEFERVKTIFSKIPFIDGQPSGKVSEAEKKAALELFPALITLVEELAVVQGLMMEAIQKDMKASKDSLELVRKSQNIFNKFVKKPTDDTPQFFDKKG